MAYKNSKDSTGQCSIDGHSAEEQFRDLAVERGYLVIASTKEQQFDHYDFLVEKDGVMSKMEVKARKKIRRADEEPDDSFAWLEWKNVRGDAGWLVGGADFVVFEQKNEFIIVNRLALLKLAEKLVDRTKVVDKPHKAFNCSYRRFRRKDEISYILTSEIKTLKHSIWPKNPTP